MRAISLTITAFGPYRDKQTVNFNDLGDESIFLITGPTGAGKTTIFDAICYALYGRASGSDRDQDSLRSHFANVEQPTEVEFVFGLKGKTYAVTRYPRQQKRKERGDGFTEDPARAELYQLVDDKKQLMFSKIKDVNETVEEMLGLDYEQFRKMIMIPQGEFRRLISENSKDREEILQKIFRTYFYERITDELKKQSKELQQLIKQTEWQLDQEIAKIQWKYRQVDDEDTINDVVTKLTEEITKTVEEINEYNSKLEKEKKSLKAVQENYYAAKQLADKFNDYTELTKQKKDLEEQQKLMDKKKETIELARKASVIIPVEESATSRKQEWVEQVNKVNAQQERVQQLKDRFAIINEKYEEEAKKEKERELQKEKIDKNKEQLESVKQYTILNQKLLNVEKEKIQEEKEQASIQEKINKYLKDLEELDKQVKDQSGWTKAFYENEADRKQLSEKLAKLERLQMENKKLVSLRNNFQKVNRTYVDLQNQLNEKRKEVQQLEDEQKKHHAYHLALQLQSGSACPVCGSTEHPLKASEDSTVVTDEQIKKVKEEVSQKEKELERWQDHFVQVKSEGQAQRRLVEDMHEELKEEIQTLEDPVLKEKVQVWKQDLEKLTMKHKEIKNQLTRIENAVQQYQQVNENKKELDLKLEKQKQVVDLAKEKYIRLTAQIEQTEKELEDKTVTLEQLQLKIQNEEAAYNERIKAWERIQEEHEQTKTNLQEAHTVLEQLHTFVADTKERYESEVNIFKAKVTENGFETVEAYQAAKSTEEKQQQLQQEITAFDNKKSSVLARLEEVSSYIEGRDKPDLSKLSEEVKELEQKIDNLNQYIQGIQLIQQQNDQIKQTIDTLLGDYNNLNKQYYDIGELADLARGENHLKLSFERYVLSSFLDEILLQANIRLDQLSEHRFQLIRSDQVAKRGAQSGLDLEVLDHHTGQQRSVKTLSGGEGFKAALSLALGMADVVQAHAGGVQLETLFIDEGFGTLDELSLAQAIDCLKGLQQSNRVLGIISHVPQLKEEIHAKLQITPSPQGSSLAFTF